jgi:hypothetical protein
MQIRQPTAAPVERFVMQQLTQDPKPICPGTGRCGSLVNQRNHLRTAINQKAMADVETSPVMRPLLTLYTLLSDIAAAMMNVEIAAPTTTPATFMPLCFDVATGFRALDES